ncbi:MAG TPA: M48 family metalloprotease [Azospirillaceae bacterium]|nr:M48 family metalloprotease [Azospirillaceae bacterium]
MTEPTRHPVPAARPVHATRRARPLLAMAAAAALLAGCSTNPATERRQFTGLMSQEQEQQVGSEQHEQVMQEFGGPYKDQRLQDYVNRLGQRLAANTENPEIKYTFTVLDSEIVNAFALPGGYVYVSRGLMALANSEAELAGVIGHEIGHVTGRHTAERYSRGTLAQVGAVVAGIFGGQQVAQLAGLGANLAISGWSRRQELEADSLGVRYMADAGFDPMQMAGFLDSMGRHAQLEALLAGNPGAADQFSYFQTHPPTGERVEKAAAAAQKRAAGDWEVDSEAYLRTIDGMVYGDSPENGFVRGTTFAHTQLGLRFDVPRGFRLLNGQKQVRAISPEKDAAIIFDAAPGQGVRSPEEFISRVWAAQAQLGELQRLDINGMPAATAVAQVQGQQGPMLARLVAIQWDADTFYRFVFLTGANGAGRYDEAFKQTAYSFRRLGSEDRNRFRPYRIKVVQARPGDTVESFIRRMPFDDYPEERFRVLNNIPPGTELRPGQMVKLVTEG